MPENHLPLFPLQVVLFPHAALPLHIFEERYKALMQRSIREHAEFGIVLVRGQDLADVGCSAAVTSVMKMYDDGRMDVLVEGRQRFRVRDVDDHSALYLVGTVALLPDAGTADDKAALLQAIGLYNELVHVVYGGKVKPVDPDAAVPGVSFVMAQKAGLDLEQRQRLLELDTEGERITMLLEYLTVVVPRLKRLEEVERIVHSDGYL